MKTLHKKLHLQHHAHTGKLLHHRHTSYRAIALILLVGGVFMGGFNMMARATAATMSGADSLIVTARNPAPIPTDAPVITSPQSPHNTSSAVVSVNGTCPNILPRVIIVIEDNGYPTSSTICGEDFTFAAVVTLQPGSHTLIAVSYTVTDDAGPRSAPVIVNYQPAVATAPTTTPQPPSTTRRTPSSSSKPSYEPLWFASQKPYIIFGPARDAIWSMSIKGGLAPYRVQFDWGDGGTKTYRTDGSQKTYRHHYQVTQPYTVLVTVTDKNETSIQLTIAAVTPYVMPQTPTTSSTYPLDNNTILGVYGAYLLIIALMGYYWTLNPRFVPVLQPVHIAKRNPSARRSTRR